ncbi:TolC family protein [Chlorobium sp. BLA1]|nr:TolC family protein [Candidatus Chlorobium masyuteum]
MKIPCFRHTIGSSPSHLISRLLLYLSFAALVSALPVTAMAAEVVAKKLSLSNCIEIALKNATSTLKASNNVKLQSADVLRSYGSFLPKLSLSASYTPYTLNQSYSQIFPGEPISKIRTESETVSMTLSTSLNLFNGFRDYAGLQAALQRKRASEYSLSRAIQTVAFDVTQAYYQVLLDRELLEIAKENHLSTLDQLTLTERQFQIGLKSMIDRYQQQAEAAQSNLSVIKAQTRLQHSRLELLRRLQIDPETVFILEPLPEELKKPPESKPDINKLINLALEERMDLKGSRLETSAAKWQITSARAAWYPKLDLNITTGSSGTASLSQNIGGRISESTFPAVSDQLRQTIGYNIGLNLSWAIFDGFQTSYNVQSSRINYLNRELDTEDLKYNIIIDLQQAATEYKSAFVQIEAAKVSMAAAESAYEGVKRKHELGAAGFIELSSARATRFSARSNLSQATYNLALQKSVLDYRSGIPLQ